MTGFKSIHHLSGHVAAHILSSSAVACPCSICDVKSEVQVGQDGCKVELIKDVKGNLKGSVTCQTVGHVNYSTKIWGKRVKMFPSGNIVLKCLECNHYVSNYNLKQHYDIYFKDLRDGDPLKVRR